MLNKFGKVPAWLGNMTQPKIDPQAQKGGYGYPKIQQAQQPRVPTWLNDLGRAQAQPGGYGYRGPDQRAPANRMPAWLKPGQTYQTGDNERVTLFTPTGTKLRMGPNSYYDPNKVEPTYTPVQKFMRLLQGKDVAPATPSGHAGVRG